MTKNFNNTEFDCLLVDDSKSYLKTLASVCVMPCQHMECPTPTDLADCMYSKYKLVMKLPDFFKMLPSYDQIEPFKTKLF